MVQSAEQTARFVGCPSFRSDYFIGSSVHGWVWNKFAFPNEMEYPGAFGVPQVTQTRRDLIQSGFELLSLD